MIGYDADEGVGGQLSYSIVQGPLGLFSVDPDTSEILLTRSLHWEKVKMQTHQKSSLIEPLSQKAFSRRKVEQKEVLKMNRQSERILLTKCSGRGCLPNLTKMALTSCKFT